MKTVDDEGTGEELMGNNQRDSDITERTRIPIWIAVAGITSFLGGAIWIKDSLNGLSNSIGLVNNRLTAMEAGTRDTITVRDMKIWVLQFKFDNPTIKVPDAPSK